MVHKMWVRNKNKVKLSSKRGTGKKKNEQLCNALLFVLHKGYHIRRPQEDGALIEL